MSKNKKKTSFIIRTNVWSRISIWWNIIFFLILLPAVFFILSWEYDTYMSGLADHIIKLDILGLENAVDYATKRLAGELSETQFYTPEGFLFGLLGFSLIDMLFITMKLPYAMLKSFNAAFLFLGALTFLFSALTIGSKIIRTVKTTYTFKGNSIISTTGHLFFKDEEIRRILYTPGMDVSVKQTLKGKIFNYGDIRMSLGYGDAGEVYLKGVKKPLKAKKQLLALINKKCSIMPEHGYTMNPYNTMYNVMGTYMPTGK